MEKLEKRLCQLDSGTADREDDGVILTPDGAALIRPTQCAFRYFGFSRPDKAEPWVME